MAEECLSSLSTPPPRASRADLARIALAALGVVYGDIGTSPLYTVQQCFADGHADRART